MYTTIGFTTKRPISNTPTSINNVRKRDPPLEPPEPPVMELRMELLSPSSIASVDVAMYGLLIAMGTQRFTCRKPHEILLALQSMDGTGEVILAIDALAVGSLLEA